MEKAKVYFTDFRTQLGVSQGLKLQRLCRRAGIDKIDFEGKLRRLPIWSRNWVVSLS